MSLHSAAEFTSTFPKSVATMARRASEVSLSSHWPIRNKLLVCLALLLIILTTLSASGFVGVYKYRGLVRSLRDRSAELQLATKLGLLASDARVTLSKCRLRLSVRPSGEVGDLMVSSENSLSGEFHQRLINFGETFEEYRRQIASIDEELLQMGDARQERQMADDIDATLARITRLTSVPGWDVLSDKLVQLTNELDQLQLLTSRLPHPLQQRFQEFHGEVRGSYRTLIGVNSVTTVSATVLLLLLFRLFYLWVFRPLRILIKGSRRVAAGDFSHHIQLDSRDEMAELADSMNAMTERFRVIRDDLDRQVRERTRQVIRSEQMASVGFLAAGVAHEINNPLASIAMCAESLEGRLGNADSAEDEDRIVSKQYLNMIQSEAFRCKEITEKLLDFSRMGDTQRQIVDLRELAAGVMEMVRHLGKCRDKSIYLTDGSPVMATVNPQEIKQVLLNLITNALDSLESDGRVNVSVETQGEFAQLTVADNGCGMSEEVLQHLFEPFFTRRKSGQGTGLGLSISYRIIDDHGGHIEAHSDGPGTGACFVVSLPREHARKESGHQYQAA